MAKVYILIFFILLVNNSVSDIENEEQEEEEEEQTTIGPTLQKQLDVEHRNALCCIKNMRCCRKANPPNIELRAVLARCTKPSTDSYRKRLMKKVVNQATEYKIKNFEGFDEDEPLVQSIVTKCHRKIILTIKVKNEGETNTKSQFIVIDHVYDPVSSKTVRLLNPYVLKLKQEHVSQTYPLKFIDFVNSEAREQVYNKHDGNYTGCNVDPQMATCGVVKYKGKIVPYSQGFCCSCDAQKNAERQPGTAIEQDPLIEESDPAYLFDAVQCPRTHIKSKEPATKEKQEKREKALSGLNLANVPLSLSKEDFKKLMREYMNNGNNVKKYIDSEDSTNVNDKYDRYYTSKNPAKQSLKKIKAVNNKPIKPSVHKLLNSKKSSSNPEGVFSYKEVEPDVQKIIDGAFQDAVKIPKNTNFGKQLSEDEDFRKKRQVQSSGVQKRGGQNCADRYTPPNLDPEQYQESTHCLRFSPVWYGVYKLEKPVVEQEVIIQIFEKYETANGELKWKDLTNGQKIKLGTFFQNYQDEIPTLSFRYEYTADETDFCLDFDNYRLLVPEGIKQGDLHKFPEVKGGPPEFLLVQKDKIYVNGDECDVAGVGFEAFFSQPNRCSMPRGTCLHHQPKHMWLHDKKMERLSQQGCYFLKYHASLAKDALRVNTTSDERFLTLNYYGRHVSIIDIEINADFNAVLRTQTAAVITEVYIDSTSATKTFITIKLTNSGLLSSSFYVRIADCPLDLKGKLHNVQSKLVLIAPQVQHVFKLSFTAALDIDIFYCSAEAVNSRNELVALRRIRLQKFDRCICSWHCLCACIGSSRGLKCIPMQVEHYHAAGFLGGLPVVSYVRHITAVDDVLTLVFYVLLFILFTLLVLGLTKALIGLCCVPVAVWGLNILLDLPKPMNRYYEPNLRNVYVIYDDEGWPINPVTKERVRNIPKTAEFCTNVLFFYTYPCIMLLLVFKKLCCPFYTYEQKKMKLSRKKRGYKKCDAVNCDPKCCKICDDKETSFSWLSQNSAERRKSVLYCDKIMLQSKRKPTIKVSIREHKKSDPKYREDSKSSIEISDNPYYCSSSTCFSSTAT